jgi:4-hydroxy-3-methylbut-2-enyl diphosphate reductase IspH
MQVVELEMAFAESKQQHTSVVDELDRVRDKEASQRITLESLVIEVAQLTTSHKELTEVNEELQHTLERHKATSSATMAQKICAEQERESAVSDADSLREKNAA